MIVSIYENPFQLKNIVYPREREPRIKGFPSFWRRVYRGLALLPRAANTKKP